MKASQLRIVLVNIWHDDNKGDCGIVEAMLSLLKQRWPEARFGIVSMFSEKSSAFANAHRYLQERFPDLEVTPSPFFSHDSSKTETLYQKLQKLLPIPISLMHLFLPLTPNHAGLRLISEADLVIASGGQYLFTQKNYLKSLFTIFRLLYPLLIARSHQIPYILFSQSFEFYEADRLDNRITQFILSKATKVWVREEISYQVLLNLGVPKSKVDLVPDAVFALKPHKSERVSNLLSTHRLETGQFWVVTVRKWQTYTEPFLDEMANLIKQALHMGMVPKVALVAHVHGPTNEENDRISTRHLAELLSGKAITIIEDDLSPSELSALYGEAQLMIGTRFQSVIFALVGGTPTYAVSYNGPKTWGIMEMLGMRELCSDMNSFSSDEALERLQAVDFSTLACEVPNKVNTLRQQLKDAISKLDIN